MPTLVERALAGTLPPLVDPDVARDFVWVHDACDAFLAAATADLADPGSILNVASGTQTSLGSLVELVRSLFAITAEPAWGTMERRSWDTSVWVGQPAAAAAMLGWRSRTPLGSGLLGAGASGSRPPGDRRRATPRDPDRVGHFMGRRAERPPENLALRSHERWRPPPFFDPTYGRGRPHGGRATVLRSAGGLAVARSLPRARDGAGHARGRRLRRPALRRHCCRSDTEYIGLDIRARAHADFGYAMPDVRLIAEDGRWPVADAQADVVLATETLEHVVDPPAFLAEAHRCLRPGGRLVLTVPFAARWHYIPNDYWRFTPSALRILLERAGFEAGGGARPRQ